MSACFFKETSLNCRADVTTAHSVRSKGAFVKTSLVVACVVASTWVTQAQSQDSLRWQVQAGMTYSHFQQQVKAEVGQPRGERLSYDLQFGVMALGTYEAWAWPEGDASAHAGAFLQFDRGNRLSARFNGFDSATGRTTTKDKFEGNFSEFWLGPFVRAQWRYLFGEFGWALVGFRNDGLRSDLPSSTGDTTGTFDLLPKVAIFAGLGAAVPFNHNLSMVFRFEYRLRYYKGREGQPFKEGFEHGTQNITPFIGVGWKF
jgi:hypothetical protein